MKSRYKMTLEAKREMRKNKGKIDSQNDVIEKWDNNVYNIYSRSGLFTSENCRGSYKKID